MASLAHVNDHSILIVMHVHALIGDMDLVVIKKICFVVVTDTSEYINVYKYIYLHLIHMQHLANMHRQRKFRVMMYNYCH